MQTPVIMTQRYEERAGVIWRAIHIRARGSDLSLYGSCIAETQSSAVMALRVYVSHAFYVVTSSGEA